MNTYTRKIKNVDCLMVEGKKVAATDEYPYRYHARHSYQDWSLPKTVEATHISVNFWGTVLAKKELIGADAIGGITIRNRSNA